MDNTLDLVTEILTRDRKTFLKDVGQRPEPKEVESDIPLLADFTEYNPLHKGHLHFLLEAKKAVP